MRIITRRKHWADRSGRVIEEHEWEQLLKELSGEIHTGPAQRADNYKLYCNLSPFLESIRWLDNRLEINETSEEATRIAILLSYRLRGRVQGVLGEIYYADKSNRVRCGWPEISYWKLASAYAPRLISRVEVWGTASVFVLLLVASVITSIWGGSRPRVDAAESKQFFDKLELPLQAVEEKGRDQQNN